MAASCDTSVEIGVQPVATNSGGVRGPVFIVSMWRAGSSLLYALLNQHPQVALTYEADLPLLTPMFWKPGFLRDWAKRWEFWNSALSRHGIQGGAAGGASSRASFRASFPAAFEAVHRGYAVDQGATIWGDKSPNYYDRMTWLGRRFPGARFLVVWRDPMDTARSMARAAAGGSSYFQKRGMRTRALVGYRVFRRQYLGLVEAGVPVHALDYEDLIRDPRACMEGVCRFLQVPFDDRVLTLENADRSATYEGAHHESLRGNKIIANRERAEVLEAAWKEKIARYVRWWRRQEDGWPVYPKLETPDGAEPTVWERLVDRAGYRFWKFFDWFTVVVYSFAPLDVLRRYRERKGTRASS
jgi:hypothetical protein